MPDDVLPRDPNLPGRVEEMSDGSKSIESIPQQYSRKRIGVDFTTRQVSKGEVSSAGESSWGSNIGIIHQKDVENAINSISQITKITKFTFPTLRAASVKIKRYTEQKRKNRMFENPYKKKLIDILESNDYLTQECWIDEGMVFNQSKIEKYEELLSNIKNIKEELDEKLKKEGPRPTIRATCFSCFFRSKTSDHKHSGGQ